MILVPASVVETLLVQARREHPREICAFLLGRARGSTVWVEASVPAPNLDRHRGLFVTRRSLTAARRVAHTSGSELVAVAHSHPAFAPRASDTDRRGIAVSRIPWVVIAEDSPGHASLRAYAPGTAAPIPIAVVSERANEAPRPETVHEQ